MESLTGDMEESTEDLLVCTDPSLPGRKKSKRKILKTRLFRRTKRRDEEGSAHLSQSASDIRAAKALGSEEDLTCSQGALGSRALSHDSIFQDDHVPDDLEPTRVLSQENIHSKIKALQMKLQQQKMHLGPPPLVLPLKRPDHPGSQPEHDGLPRSPPEVSVGGATTQGTSSKAIPQPCPRPLSPIPKPAPTRSVPPTPSLSTPPSFTSTAPPAAGSGLDLSAPAQFTSCLDTSAARHRMLVKPRNQRASTKAKRLSATNSRLHSDALNNTDHPGFKEETPRFCAQEGIVPVSSPPTQISGTGHDGLCNPSLPLKSLEPGTPQPELYEEQPALKPSGSAFSHNPKKQDPTFPEKPVSLAPQLLGANPQRPVDATPSRQVQSSLIKPDLTDKREDPVDTETQPSSLAKPDALDPTGLIDKNPSGEQLSTTLGSVGTFRSFTSNQQVQGEIQRRAKGSGSFHFTFTSAKARDGERPRSSSFFGTTEHGFKHGSETEVKSHASNLNQDEQKLQANRPAEDKLRELKPQGATVIVGTLKEGEVKAKDSVFPWERRDTLKKAPSQQTTVPTGASQREEMEGVEEAVEAKEDQEEEGKAAFGVKLRSTSLALKHRSQAVATFSDAFIKRNSAEIGIDTHSQAPCDPSLETMSSEEQSDKIKTREEMDSNARDTSKTLPANVLCHPTAPRSLRQTGGAPTRFQPGSSIPVVKCEQQQLVFSDFNLEAQANTSNTKEVDTAVAGPQEPQPASQPAPQTTSSEVSWMSMAMEKTRSLQQLFASRLPRDFTAMQTTPQQQTQEQPSKQEQAMSQSPLKKGMHPQAQFATQTQTVKQDSPKIPATIQTSTEASKTSMMKIASSAQTSKQSPTATIMQQNISTQPPGELNTSKIPQTLNSAQMSKQPNATQSILQSSSHSVSHPSTQANTFPAQPPLRSSAQTGSTFAPEKASPSVAESNFSSGPQPALRQPSQASRGLLSSIRAKPTASVVLPAALGGSEATPTQDAADPSPSERRAVWQGSVGGRAAFLEKRPEWTATPASKVELRKSPMDTWSQVESTNPTDTKSERRPEVKVEGSSPTKGPGKVAEREWPRKPASAASSPSSSPKPSPPLQSVSDGGQPSWMELAKRKSMAWSDKTMD